MGEVDDATRDQARRILRAVADLAPSGRAAARDLSVPTEWFRWLELRSLAAFLPGSNHPLPRTAMRKAVDTFRPTDPADAMHSFRHAPIDSAVGDRLAAVDLLRPEQRSLRLGWLFIAGRVDDGGVTRRVFHPVWTLPVRVERLLGGVGGTRLVPAGDVEPSELLADDRRPLLAPPLPDGLLRSPKVVATPEVLAQLARSRSVAGEIATTLGGRIGEVVAADRGPDALMARDDLALVVGVGVYAIHDTGAVSRAGTLHQWAESPLDVWTAFHSLYVDAPLPEVDDADGTDQVRSPFVLSPAQRDAVLRSRRDHVTVVSGAPGTGKSHTIVALACDAVARGGSVLVAARSDATVDALLDLFERAPGPDPVVFGSNERRTALADRLAAGQVRPVPDAMLRAASDELAAAEEAARACREEVVAGLEAEVLLARGWPPGDPLLDLDALDELLEAASGPRTWWWQRRRRASAARMARSQLGLDPGADQDEVVAARRDALARRAAARLAADGGLRTAARLDALLTLEATERAARGRWLAAESRSARRLHRGALRSVGALATALRSGRAARRDQLRRIGDRALTHALPLWVGSLPDIDDLLPPTPGLFDLVVLDEASSIDQTLAVPALLRARRCVVVGDPQQLRHVSFLADARQREVIAAHGLDAEPLVASRLDLRRNSAFDVAASVSPVVTLDEHHRSAPHLVDFVAERMYGGRVHVATRAPSTSTLDCVRIVRLDGRRDRKGVVGAEVDWVMAELRQALDQGRRSIGVISPFRAQADALEGAVLERFRVDEIERLDLRVGTVHAFQGNERDLVIVSMGIGPDESGASWRFVEDPHLFTVLVSRARRRMLLLLSAEPPEGGLVADYVHREDAPPGPPPSVEVDPWVHDVAEDLRTAGLGVQTGYPTGGHVVDLVLSSGPPDVAVECSVHADGADAHVERHLALRRAGWRIHDLFPSCGDRRAERVVELLDMLGPSPSLDAPTHRRQQM